ncbi:competence protein ComEA [Ruthenibacterium lactatiformans]|uniref:Competence protein ComEA n=1 Tax=Ruthenibacterium lactatiformans TaxID=1550024 RepID=A0A0W7TMM8_9FIRM|nr:competence protein ComEA [Ruthenibacterium lactatiformans]
MDVNTAPAAELETLPGIGEKKALTIVEYREANGPFRAVEELERVKGISERTVDGMRAYVRVS